MSNPVLEAISQRRSIRGFTSEPVPEEDLTAILEAGRWAPSGLNNQPWRFVIFETSAGRERLSGLTKYSRVIQEAAVCVAVFLDAESCYDQIKDTQGAGACLQNMLLAAHSLGLGAVWLGEILKSGNQVRELCGLGDSFSLQAVVAMGHPSRRDQSKSRRPLDELILGRM